MQDKIACSGRQEDLALLCRYIHLRERFGTVRHDYIAPEYSEYKFHALGLAPSTCFDCTLQATRVCYLLAILFLAIVP